MSSSAACGRIGAALVVLATALIGTTACGGPDSAGHWPQWRGAGGSGVSDEQGLPVRWTESEGIRWTVDVPGNGNSSPIVGRDQVYLTLAEGPAAARTFSVLALDLSDGATAWRTDILVRPEEITHRLNTPAGATPATDGESVFVYFGSHLAALDLAGEVRWSREIDREYLERSRYGAASSLIVVDDTIVVLQDREKVSEEEGWLAAFAKADGSELWRVTWTHTCCSYVTPLLLEVAGQKQIFVAHAKEVTAYDPETGAKLWTRPQEMNQPVASPVVDGDLVCTASGADNVRETVCRRISRQGDNYAIEELWRSNRAVPSTASPLLHGGRLYLMVEKGILVCVEAETGQLVWRARLPARVHHASLVLGDGKIYATAAQGSVAVLAEGATFELLSDNPLPEKGVVASPALADGCLLVRTPTKLLCIEGIEGG